MANGGTDGGGENGRRTPREEIDIVDRLDGQEVIDIPARLSRRGADMSMAEQRERMRGRLATWILALLAAQVAAIVVLALLGPAFDLMKTEDVKDIALIFFPTTASIFATVVGFYFGSVHREQEGNQSDGGD